MSGTLGLEKIIDAMMANLETKELRKFVTIGLTGEIAHSGTGAGSPIRETTATITRRELSDFNPQEKAQKEVGGVTIRSSMLIVTKLQLNSDFT